MRSRPASAHTYNATKAPILFVASAANAGYRAQRAPHSDANHDLNTCWAPASAGHERANLGLALVSRADAVARTRDAIVAAARDLHSERGLAATSWEDIADRAGVSTATVYRHFPSTSELVPACARTVFDLIQPPTLEQASAARRDAPAARNRQTPNLGCTGLTTAVARSAESWYRSGAWKGVEPFPRGAEANSPRH